MKAMRVPIVAVALAAFFALGWALSRFYTRNQSKDSMLILREYNPALAAEGCILFSHDVSLTESDHRPENKPRVFLVNNSGKLVHSWSLDWPVKVSHLDKEGNLWVASGIPWAGKGEPKIQKIDGKSRVIAERNFPGLHHDFDLDEDGNTLALAIRVEVPDSDLPPAFRESKRAGRTWMSEQIIEYDFEKGVQKSAIDLLPLFPITSPNQAQQSIGSIYHLNSIRLLKKNPVNGRPAYLVSLRNLSTIAILERETGKPIWTSSPGTFSYPHDANLLPNGDLLVFNNGRDKYYSSIIQWDVRKNELAWQYTSKFAHEFYSHLQGSVQRLDNGNTLIGNSLSGNIFEVSPEGEVVLEFFSPFFLNSPSFAWPFSPIFRTRKFNSQDVDWEKLGVECQ